MRRDDDVKRVLTEDGLDPQSLNVFHKYENTTTINLSELRCELGMGSWAVRIEGEGTKTVKKNDIIVVPSNTWHQIKCVSGPGVRYAITQPDVEHVYEQ